MRKYLFSICKNKGADQLCGICAADQSLCFHTGKCDFQNVYDFNIHSTVIRKYIISLNILKI